jgi:hypothetical protein
MNAALANNIGNMLNRSLNLLKKFCQSEVSRISELILLGQYNTDCKPCRPGWSSRHNDQMLPRLAPLVLYSAQQLKMSQGCIFLVPGMYSPPLLTSLGPHAHAQITIDLTEQVPADHPLRQLAG